MTAALGGHVEGAGEDCGHRRIVYNSCRNRHCPKCQGAAAREWLAAREADLLPVGYYHVVFTLPAEIADIAFHNKAEVYDLLFRVAAETMLTIAADPRHLGARIGVTAVLHSWGSAMTHHPHIHMIELGGCISLDGERWVSSRARFLLPVRVLGKAVPAVVPRQLAAASCLRSSSVLRRPHRIERATCLPFRHLAPLRKKRWVVLQATVLRAGSGARLFVAIHPPHRHLEPSADFTLDEHGVTFRYKDYRCDGPIARVP